MSSAARTSRRRGLALLEIVLSLALFVAASTAILGGLGACLRSAQDARLSATASDLAVTLLSEIQMGLVPLENDGPNEYEDERLTGWTWEVIVADAEAFDTEAYDDGPVTQYVEVVVSCADPAYEYRLSDQIRPEDVEPEEPDGEYEEEYPEFSSLAGTGGTR